jgi:membrane-bound lytic murein transglycosylase B
MHRLLARRAELSERVVPRLSKRVRAELRASSTAQRALAVLARPIEDVDAFKTGRPAPAATLRRYYRSAQRRFGVRWEVLAAVNFVESHFGKVKATSYAGAQGPMQFLPSTWEAYGLGGDIQDDRDAILAAANYLSASGAPENYRAALYAYNPSNYYVDAVLAYAAQIMRRPQSFYIYYSWQVYVLTEDGPLRITGPGVRRT